MPDNEEDFLTDIWLILTQDEFDILKKLGRVVLASFAEDDSLMPEEPTPAEEATLVKLMGRIAKME